MANLYYFNKFTDKLELVTENIKDVNENYNNLIIDFYYDTEMNEGYREIKEIIKEWDETWKNATPPDTKSVYFLKTETRTFIFIESLLSVGQ